MSRWLIDYASVDFWMKTQHIYRSTFTFLTLLTSPHLVFSLVPQKQAPINAKVSIIYFQSSFKIFRAADRLCQSECEDEKLAAKFAVY